MPYLRRLDQISLFNLLPEIDGPVDQLAIPGRVGLPLWSIGPTINMSSLGLTLAGLVILECWDAKRK